jgi:NAD(P)-dependent dehydrogenase (short-subunit alcohol dehydrogenase family)
MNTSPVRTALVTGASRGIGRAIAHLLASRGVRVAVHYRNDHAAAAASLAALPTLPALPASPVKPHAAFAADLADPESTQRLWREVADQFGTIDMLINNAGIYIEHPPLRTGLDSWLSAWSGTLGVNLIASANLSLLAAQAMSARADADGAFGRGRIVNISSRGAFRGEPDAPAYGASKAGLNALSQSLAKALAPQGIYVYCIAPGWVETEMAKGNLSGPDGPAILAQHPLGRVSQPEEVAQAAVYCALDAPAAMTGCIIDVNGASYLRT